LRTQNRTENPVLEKVGTGTQTRTQILEPKPEPEPKFSKEPNLEPNPSFGSQLWFNFCFEYLVIVVVTDFKSILFKRYLRWIPSFLNTYKQKMHEHIHKAIQSALQKINRVFARSLKYMVFIFFPEIMLKKVLKSKFSLKLSLKRICMEREPFESF
jgi:hypothetical protein